MKTDPPALELVAVPHERTAGEHARPFWLGDALTVGARGLSLDGVALAEVAREHGTPVYVYGAATVRRRLAEIRAALGATGAPFRIHYAMKANRCGALLDLVRREGDVGIDACSPREVERALAAGFAPGEISVTAGMLSNRDLEAFARHGVHVNLDTTSALRRWALLGSAGRGVGLRVDPGVHVGWGEGSKLSYGGGKFGFEPGAAREAATFAASRGLEVDTLHMHLGWGLQARDAGQVEVALRQLAALAAEIPSVRTLNVGGGLCSRQRASDEPLPVQGWSRLLRAGLSATGCTIACEPGTFVAASAGVLVAEVTTVERRRGELWIGLDAGSNVNGYMAHYGIPLAFVPIERPLAPPVETAHVAGNINEANDVFARGIPVPRLEEGDLVALYPAGAYGASMASDHCLRGLPREVLV